MSEFIVGRNYKFHNDTTPFTVMTICDGWVMCKYISDSKPFVMKNESKGFILIPTKKTGWTRPGGICLVTNTFTKNWYKAHGYQQVTWEE